MNRAGFVGFEYQPVFAAVKPIKVVRYLDAILQLQLMTLHIKGIFFFCQCHTYVITQYLSLPVRLVQVLTTLHPLTPGQSNHLLHRGVDTTHWTLANTTFLPDCLMLASHSDTRAVYPVHAFLSGRSRPYFLSLQPTAMKPYRKGLTEAERCPQVLTIHQPSDESPNDCRP